MNGGKAASWTLGVLSTVLTLSACEGAMRARNAWWLSHGSSEPSAIRSKVPGFLWEYRPGSKRVYRLKDDSYDSLVVARFNRFGFRETDLASRDCLAGTYRIAVIGELVTEGLGIREEDTFVRGFEAGLGERYPVNRYNIMNSGVGGYNAQQIRVLLEARVLDFDPNAVIYMFHLNDFDFEDASGQLIAFFSDPPRSYLLKFLTENAARILARNEEYHQRHFARNKTTVFSSLKEMANLLAEHDVVFLVAVLPVFRHPVDLPAAQSRLGREESVVDDRLDEIHAAVIDYLRTINVPNLDLREAFLSPRFRHVGLDRWHPRVEGLRVIAEELIRITPESFDQENAQ